MKKFLTLAICAMMMAVGSASAQQQSNQNNPNKQGKQQRMSREQLAEAHAKHIAHDLALDDATTQKFVKTFSDYQKEMWALNQKGCMKKADMTEAEAEQALKSRFEQSQKLLSLREKYYKEYSKFLTQKQIQRVYELEKQTMKRLEQRRQMGKHPQQGPRPQQGLRPQQGQRPQQGFRQQQGQRPQQGFRQQQGQRQHRAPQATQQQEQSKSQKN